MTRVLAVFCAFLGICSAFADSPDTYDETVNFSPPFSENQNDPALQDLFNPANNKSGLCVPTTLANILADQRFWRTPSFPQIRLKQTPEQGDYSQEVRYLAQACMTDPAHGTLVANAANCVRRLYQNSGYSDGWAWIVGKDEGTDPASVRFWGGPRSIGFQDLRYYLQNHVGVLMDLEWEVEDGGMFQDTSWTPKGGHTFWVTGYDYDYAWGDTQIMLKVVNPEMTYAADDAADHYDEVTVISDRNTDSGVDFPPGFHLTISGKGFPTDPVRGFIRNIMIMMPDNSVSPFRPRQNSAF